MKVVFKGHVTPADKRRSDYLYVPFELSEPASRLRVQYRYSAAIRASQHGGGNVIDIGLFDPRGADFPGGAGFRGWSGSDRREFTITPTAATPGYLPGPLPGGRYQVILGLYQIWNHGADYEVEIEADLGAPEVPPPAPTPAAQPARNPPAVDRSMSWLRGDLQCHSEHSDGADTLAQLTARARALKLDFLAVTDHNTVSHHPHLPALADDDLLLIPGQEVTTYYGHMNIWGANRWCDFRCRSKEEIAAVIDLAHASGGLCSINHPKTNGPPWEYAFNLPVDAMEVWQGPWPARNEESLAFWHNLLGSGRQVPAVGSSDYHRPPVQATDFPRLGQPTTWVKAAGRSVPAVLDAIRAGRAFISAVPEGPRLDLCAVAANARAEMGGELSLAPGTAAEVEAEIEGGGGWTLRLIADGEVAHEASITTDQATVRATVTANVYVCAELVGDVPREWVPDDIAADLDLREWRWALTNPIYMRRVNSG
jgi:hypothetical protein